MHLQRMTQKVAALYDSGADGHYISEHDRKQANMPAMKKSTLRVGVANGKTSEAVNTTRLPFKGMSDEATRAGTFDNFKNSLLSVRKFADDGITSILTKDGVTVHKEEDVLIMCKGEPLLIGCRDQNGRYRIPLVQQNGKWKPHTHTKRVHEKLQQANSVYNLPSIEQAIKWMHAVVGYPVKSTWLKAVEAGNFKGWPLVNKKNVKRYYPETNETPKGHLNQTRQNVRSLKKCHSGKQIQRHSSVRKSAMYMSKFMK